ncbi:MAG: hypothetical protein J7J91_08350 [Deltaproteobacteria bacterium]|nr:hypothetical protein [Deltaproteobacteria bacterium]
MQNTHRPRAKEGHLSTLRPRELLQLPGKKALDLILESGTPASLVQSMAEEDVFWLVQDIGPEDALPILSVASNDQWQYLLDMDLWQRDRLRIDSVNRWFALLLQADMERFLIWALRKQRELVKLHLSRNIDVRIRNQDESPSDFAKDYFTFDNVFYIHIKSKDHYHTIRQLLERLAEHDLDKFHQVLLELNHVLPAESEENLYRLRSVRLAEKGFLPFDEAVGIYQHIDTDALVEKKPEVQKIIQQPQPSEPAPLSASLLIQDRNLFYKALKRIEPGPALERLQMEFAAMCNQIISADGLMVRDKEKLASVVRKACGYLAIGLERLAGNDTARACLFLQKTPLSQVFRVGYSAALNLKWKAEKWFRKSWFVRESLDLSFWDDEWGGILEGLLKKRPLFYTGLSGGELYREFRNSSDISYCHSALEQIMALDHLMSLLFAGGALPYRGKAWQPVNYKNLLLTSWARDHLDLPESDGTLLVNDMKTFFRDLWAKGQKPYRVDEKMKQSFVDWLTMRSGLPAADLLGDLGKTFERLFVEIETEYGSVSIQDLDPRYVKHFLVVL